MRCGASDARWVAGVARAFGLKRDPEIYREIDRAEARTILVGLLRRDLAYGVEVMPVEKARALVKRFLAEHATPGCRYFTNKWLHAPPVGWSWIPATKATFDLGVLVVGESSSACLWVEEED